MQKASTRSKLSSRLYIGKSTYFKIFLLIGVAVISAVFVWYTFNVIDKLQKSTRSQVVKYVKLWQLAASSTTGPDELQFIFDEIIVKADFPIIVLDENDEPVFWRNIDEISASDTSTQAKVFLKREVTEMIASNGRFPLEFGEGHVSYFCYGDSAVIRQLTMMPFIEIGIVIAFLLVALIGFQNIKRSEERHIWVGMAKETAHQLGTPITSLMGWIEVMESEATEAGGEHEESIKEALGNMRVDTGRLQRIANRFGQIGSVPETTEQDVNSLVLETVEYYRRRLPFEGKGVVINFTQGEIPKVQLNPELFGWALENLLKNALQAVDSKTGQIDIVTSYVEAQNQTHIEITDNGKGIPPAAVRKIFRAGFTTKKRGWGLGLTLVKRIVEEYHNGRLVLKKTRPGDTTFEITLPVDIDNKGSV